MKTTLAIFALLLLAGNALAVPLNPDGTAMWFTDASAMVIRCQDGRTHMYSAPKDTWILDIVPPIPVPDEEVANWFGYFFIRTDGTLWAHDNNPAVGWHEMTDFPCEVLVPNQSQSMGSLKSMYR